MFPKTVVSISKMRIVYEFVQNLKSVSSFNTILDATEINRM